MRFTREHVRQWHEEGFVTIERFFRPQEYEPVLADYERLYADAGKGEGVGVARRLEPNERRAIRIEQFKNIHQLPFEGSSAINLIALHPELIAFARALLGVSDVHMYQCHTWAKYTGEADYDQDFHCDFGNHTLVAPSDDPRLRTVAFVFYLTDVTPEHGAMRYVTKPDVAAALGSPAVRIGGDEQQTALHAIERTAAVPAGSLLVHGIDTVHRGSNLTAPGGRRFSMTASYKAAGNDLIGFHVWQARGNRPWGNVIHHATPEQLACLGIPKPGHPYWTPRTLELTQARWPDWNMRPYFAALEAASPLEGSALERSSLAEGSGARA